MLRERRAGGCVRLTGGASATLRDHGRHDDSGGTAAPLRHSFSTEPGHENPASPRATHDGPRVTAVRVPR